MAADLQAPLHHSWVEASLVKSKQTSGRRRPPAWPQKSPSGGTAVISGNASSPLMGAGLPAAAPARRRGGPCAVGGTCLRAGQGRGAASPSINQSRAIILCATICSRGGRHSLQEGSRRPCKARGGRRRQAAAAEGCKRRAPRVLQIAQSTQTLAGMGIYDSSASKQR